MAVLENAGWCPTCAREAVFRAEQPWLREHYRCVGCGSLPRERARYVPSQFFPGQPTGQLVGGVRCEDLEALTFPDASIDLHVTQDVMEHVFHPARVFREIARTLRPGGAHVFTVPLVSKTRSSRRRARLRDDGQVEHLEPPTFHGNPVSEQGALVTMDWGFDICRHIHEACGLFTHVLAIDDVSRGIRAELIEVLLTFKPQADAGSKHAGEKT